MGGGGPDDMASNRPLPTTIGGGRGRPDSGGMISLAHGGTDAGGRLPAVTGAGSEAAKPRGARALCLAHDGADLPRRHRRLPSRWRRQPAFRRGDLARVKPGRVRLDPFPCHARRAAAAGLNSIAAAVLGGTLLFGGEGWALGLAQYANRSVAETWGAMSVDAPAVAGLAVPLVRCCIAAPPNINRRSLG